MRCSFVETRPIWRPGAAVAELTTRLSGGRRGGRTRRLLCSAQRRSQGQGDSERRHRQHGHGSAGRHLLARRPAIAAPTACMVSIPIRARGRKGALAALRDAALLKVVYGYGLRRQEAVGLDLADLRSNPVSPRFDRFGALFVRFGKSSKGGPPKRRTVLTVPEFDWIVDLLDHYLSDVRPAFSPGDDPAVWVTERHGRLSRRAANEAFETARASAGLAPELDLHSLRHSYVTHLVEFGYPERFVQDQVGHAYASTTAIYTGVSDEFRNRLLRRALMERYGELWEVGP